MAKRGRKLFTIELLVERGIFPPDWKEKMLELGRGGGHKTELMVMLGINRDTFYRLVERSPQFSDTVNEFHRLSEVWWINIAKNEWIKGNSKSINSNHWSLMMRNMFKDNWSDRKDIDITSKNDKLGVSTIEVEIVKTVTNESKESKESNKPDTNP